MEKYNVMEREQTVWSCAVQLFSTLHFFRIVVKEIGVCLWWRLADKVPSIVDCCQSVTSVISSGCVWWSEKDEGDGGHNICVICDTGETDNVEHFLCSCPMLDYLRRELLSKCENKVKCETYSDMRVIKKFELILMDGGYEDFEKWIPLGCIVVKGIHKMLQYKKSVLNSM